MIIMIMISMIIIIIIIHFFDPLLQTHLTENVELSINH